MHPSPKKARGFSLLELMVALAVASILAVVAAPSFRDMLRRNKVSAASNALLADLAYARSEAINRGNSVSMCPSSDQKTCASSSTAYESGWIIYTYVPGKGKANSAYDSSDSSNVLLRASNARDNVSIQSVDSTIVSFGSQGQTQPSGKQFKFDVCFRPPGASGSGSSTDKVPGSMITVNASGSASSKSLPVQTGCAPS